MRLFLAIVVFSLIVSASSSWAQKPSFESWLRSLRAEAHAKGISDKTLDVSLSGIAPIPRIIELDRKQPEGTMTFSKYRERVINDARVQQGRRLYSEHRALLDATAEKYGVPAPYIVALWGIETSYGNNTGGFGVVSALATLAYDGRRSEFFRNELIKALQIIDQGHISHDRMKGSWAGAMGQNQFMPSSFHAYAVDGNGDGRRDIWTSLPDVFASTANYLGKSGWKFDERWGRAVKLPAGFPKSDVGLDTRLSLADWRRKGVTLPDGSALPVVDGMTASVVVPDGIGGAAYLVYDNYRVIMKWNKSTYFATSVGLLADRIAQ